MADVKLMVLYPIPKDIAQFDSDYRDHIRLLHQKANIPEDARPYTVMRFFPTPAGPAPFYQLFTMPFPSAEALQQAMSTPEMQEVAADAVRISSGGAPVILVGSEVS
ncbi:EthD family protein [Syntrophotalea carbinolica DSM 2380]|uniref:EthD family protein n=1 Tax=Syntrophotalea carbinolica (strain DSM 2380 / NBRC 103641 / GraBd1) TaxID=338963 RepID=Q3A5X0_SYNC1|nr:EthD family reductase [Syntrophotalea carbinolica]ABA88237.1 EthD family protein [Syntrophotalea carbinolica DSM 2380]